MLQMFDAIHLLHSEAKLLHKDIKLDNFRVDDKGHVRMIDFGIVADYFDHQKGCHYQQYETQFQGTPLTGSIAAL
jgi:serine/threonine protein kinase